MFKVVFVVGYVFIKNVVNCLWVKFVVFGVGLLENYLINEWVIIGLDGVRKEFVFCVFFSVMKFLFVWGF